MTLEGRTDRWSGRIVAALAVIAAGLTLFQVTRPGLLFGLTPDVSVYAGAAVRLLHGAVPYRDFVFVQPPAIVVLTTPFALLAQSIGTRDALAVLRLLTPLLAAGNVLLMGRLVRHRGAAATLVACTVMACYPAELYAIRGPQLEPIVDLLCLAGAALLFAGDRLAGHRRRVAGGVAFGVATAVKLPALIPIAVIAILCVPSWRRRVPWFGAGVAAGFAVISLPFIALAPAAFWQDAMTTQLARIPSAGRASLTVRLGELTGLSEVNATGWILAATVIALAGFIVAAFALGRRRRPITPLEWFALASVVAVAAAQLAPAQYYPQYAALLAPFLGLAFGLAVGRVAELADGRAVGLVTGVTALACVVLLSAQGWYVRGERVPDTASEVTAVVPAGACTLSNSPVYLFTADRFQARAPGCTTMTDPAGTLLALGQGAAAAPTWRAAFAHVDYVVTDVAIARWPLPAAAGVPGYVARNFTLVRSGGLLVYVRRGFPAHG